MGNEDRFVLKIKILSTRIASDREDLLLQSHYKLFLFCPQIDIGSNQLSEITQNNTSKIDGFGRKQDDLIPQRTERYLTFIPTRQN